MFRLDEHWRDRLLLWAVRMCGLLAASVLVSIVAFLVLEAWPALTHVGPRRFFTDPSWHPASQPAQFGIVPMLVGSLLVALGAVLLSAPLGLASAIFCNFYAPTWLARIYRRLLEILAGVPSVIFGFWGLVVFAPLLARWQPPGQGLLTGVLVLTLMILPTLALLADAALAAVPGEYMSEAAALGIPLGPTIRYIILPAASPGLFVAGLLQVGRALGETMAVVMVCGNVVQLPDSLVDPVRTLTANMALEMAYAVGDHRSALYVSGLLLIGLVSTLVLLSRRVERTRGGNNG